MRRTASLAHPAPAVRPVTCCCLASLHRAHIPLRSPNTLDTSRNRLNRSHRQQQQQLWLQQMPLCPQLQPQQQQQQQQQQQRRHSVQTRAVQVDLLLPQLLGSISGWATAAALAVGLLLGLLLAKFANSYLSKEADAYAATLENAELRTKVEELQQLVLKVQPLAYKSMRLRFTKGINKAVILGMVDTMLANKEVNIWWLPDSIERLFYFNMMTLMLSVLEEVVDGMSISLAGHNVKLQLTHLDLAPDGEATSRAAQKTEAMLKRALEPSKTYGSTATGTSATAATSSS